MGLQVSTGKESYSESQELHAKARMIAEQQLVNLTRMLNLRVASLGVFINPLKTSDQGSSSCGRHSRQLRRSQSQSAVSV